MSTDLKEKKSVEDWLREVDYSDDPGYVPSEFALEFVNFIKLVNGEDGEENQSPVIHYKMLDNIHGKKQLIANMLFRGAGKLESASSMLVTSNGFKSMEDIVVGDIVIDRNGKPTKVTYKTLPQYPVMYKMSLTDGTVLEVGGEHLHVVTRTDRGKVVDSVVSTNDMISRGLFIGGDSTTGHRARASSSDPKKIYRFRIPLTKPVELSKASLHTEPYTTGYMIANGSFGKTQLSAHSDDICEIINYVKSSGYSVGKISNTSGFGSRTTVLGRPFDRYCFGRSSTRRIPKPFLFGSIDQRLALLRGLMDGDGNIQKNGGCRYSTFSEGLSGDVVSLVQSLGGIATVKKYRTAEFAVTVRMPHFNPFRLKRKAEKWKAARNKTKGVVSIEEFECHEPAYCIAVESDTHTYLTRGYTVTHNTTLLCEYMFLYLAVFGSIPGFGKVTSAIYVAHSVDKGVKDLRRNVEARYHNSDFMKDYVPVIRFTDTRLFFKNKFGKEFIVNGFGVLTGVRGKKEVGLRPELAFLDDMISDSDARSDTVINSINDVVYKAVNHAMHPSRKKIIWTGTPFNARDPLYKAIESGAWYVSVYPVCERFPCDRKEFKGAWADRFGYDFVKEQHSLAVKSGMADAFHQELMLRILNEEERLINDGDIEWYKHRSVKSNRGAYNFYITTDFATSDKQHADYSVINVWGLNNIGEWYWVDGICKQMLMDQSMDHLFKLAQKWKPQGVGVEVTGQQGGFIQWIKQLMQDRNIFFALACPLGSNKPGLRPTKDKMSRFQTNAVPLFKSGKIHFPEELKESDELDEVLNELRLATVKGFKSAHDDCHPFRTLVDTPLGQIPIGLLRNGDRVFTYKDDHRLTGRVESFRMTGVKQVLKITLENENVIECSQYHPLLTENGYVVAKDLRPNTKLVRSKLCKSSTTILNGHRGLRDTTNQQLDALMGAGRTGSISINMRKRLVEFLKDLKYITSMRIRTITNLVILHYLRILSIEQGIEDLFRFTSLKTIKKCNGLPSLQEEVCTKARNISVKSTEVCQENVKIVQKNLSFMTKLKTTLSSAARGVMTKTVELLLLVLQSVSGAESPFSKKNLRNSIAVEAAFQTQSELDRLDCRRKNALSVDGHSLMVGELLRVEKNASEYEKIVKTENTVLVEVMEIELVNIEPTYNFEVAVTHNYSVENGYVVHNCLDTITMLGEINVWRPSEEAPIESSEEKRGGGSIWGSHVVKDKGDDSSYFV